MSIRGQRINLGLIVSIIVSTITLAAVVTLIVITQNALVKKVDDAETAKLQSLKNDVDKRIGAYLDQQYGFRALFYASDNVTQEEFDTYFKAISLSERYPGFYAISMIRYVENENLDQYKIDALKDPYYQKVDAEVNKLQATERGYLLPVGFIEPLPKDGKNYGIDLGVSNERRETLIRAKETGQPAFSPVFDLNSLSVGEERRKGFVVSLPIELEGETFGFINAVFDYTAFYKEILTGDKYDGLGINIVDEKGVTGFDNKVIVKDADDKMTATSIAGKKINVTFPKNFGLDGNEDKAPLFLLVVGTLVWVLLNFVLVLNHRKRSSAMRLAMKMTKDLSIEKTKAVEEEAKIKSILQSIGDGVFAIDTDRKIILFNEAAEELSGYSVQEAIGSQYDEILGFTNETTHKKSDSFINESLAGHKSKMANHTYLTRKNGTKLSVADSASPIINNQGTVLGAIIVFRDASEERELSRRAQIIAEAKAKDDALIQAIGEGLIVFDNQGYVTRFNKITQKLLGLTEDELVGKKFVDTISARNFDGSLVEHDERGLMKVAKTHKLQNMSFEYERKDGQMLPVRTSVSPIFVKGQMTGAIELFQDITAERELDKSKDDFIGLVSHQLSTPATAVKANLGMIVEGLATEANEIAEIVKEAYDSNERQIQIVQDFLNVARLENNRLNAEKESIDVREMIAEVLKDQAVELENRKHVVNISCDKDVRVVADPHLLSFVFNNLVNNASKYSDEGKSIAVDVSANDEMVSIKVIDNGVGIAKDDIDKLFKRFSRIDNDLSTVVGGTGLGLYIAKKMVDMMDGTLRVESEKNAGTTFVITLSKGE